MADEEPYNYLTQENSVLILKHTSQISHCPIKNILSSERKAIWLSDYGLPQSFIIDLSKQTRRPKFFKCFGFDCWHDYASNPSILELLVSTDGSSFITWTILHAELRAGVQLFSIDPIGNKYNYLKVIIKETFGASKTYLNQIFLFEENPLKRIKSVHTTSSEEGTSLNNSEIIGDKKDDVKVVKPIPLEHQGRISVGKDDTPNVKGESFFGDPSTNINNSQARSSTKKSLSENPGHSRSMPRLTANVNAHDNSGHLPRDDSQTENIFSNNYSGTFKPQIRPNTVTHQQQQLTYGPNQSPYQNFNSTGSNRANTTPPMFMNPSENTFGGHLSNNRSMDFMQNLITMNNQASLPLRNIAPMDPASPRALQFNQQQQQYGHDHLSIYNVPSQQQQQQQQNQQSEKNHFINILNEKLTHMNNEVNRLAVQAQTNKDDNAIDRYLLNNQANSDVDDVKKLPLLLTQTEKDVIKVKKEMDRWNGIINKLQENMSNLLEKVTAVQDNMEYFKKNNDISKLKDDTIEGVSTTEPSHNDRKIQSTLIINECVEVLKHKMTGVFEGIKSQNEQIIDDNKKLRQAIDHQLPQLSGNLRGSYRSESPLKQFDPKEVEKIANTIFERNIKSWENIFYTHQKTQGELLEDKFQQKINNNIESVKSSCDSRLRRFEEELAFVKKKVDELEKSRATARPEIGSTLSTPYLNYDEPPVTSKERPNHYPEIYLTNKENLQYYQNNNTRRNKPTSYNSDLAPVHKSEQQLKKDAKDDSIKEKSFGGNNEAYNKIALLMEKLQEKISLRDKKLQQLKNEMSTGSGDKENESFNNQNKELDSSRDSLEESLFNKKGKPQLATKPKKSTAKNY